MCEVASEPPLFVLISLLLDQTGLCGLCQHPVWHWASPMASPGLVVTHAITLVTPNFLQWEVRWTRSRVLNVNLLGRVQGILLMGGVQGEAIQIYFASLEQLEMLRSWELPRVQGGQFGGVQ